MPSATPTIPPGEGTPRGFQPSMKPAEVVQLLRLMLARMVEQDTKDAGAAKPINKQRKQFEQAVQEVVFLANAARFTGLVPPSWLPNVGRQQPLLLPADAGQSQPAQATN